MSGTIDTSTTMYPSVFDSLGYVRYNVVTQEQEDEKCFGEYLDRSHLDMKDHQLEGVLWALDQERIGHLIEVGDKVIGVRCGLLADEMGLGKTIQMIGTMVCNPLNHTLIVVPRALMEQWEKAYVSTTGDSPIIFHGQARHKYSVEDLSRAKVVITTYHHIADRKSSKSYLKKMNEEKLAKAALQDDDSKDKVVNSEPPTILHRIAWDRVIYDEAHHLRNDGTAIGAGAKKLRASIRWLVTGTPIQNRKSDFYCLCEQMGLPKAYYTNSENLLTLVRTFIKKRTKKDVGIVLPELRNSTETVEWGSSAERELKIFTAPPESDINKSKVDNAIASLDMPHCLDDPSWQMCVMPALMTHKMKDYVVSGAVEGDASMFRGMTATSKLDAVTKKIVSRKDNGRGKLVFCHFRGN